MIISNKQEGFILVDETGRFKIYKPTGEIKLPFAMVKELPTTVDTHEPWSQHL
jgi:hypothetical protein